MTAETSYDVEKDRELVRACAAGCDAARNKFVEQYQRLIFKVVATTKSRFRADRAETEDMVGHVFEKLLEDDCRRLCAWRGLSKLSTYIVMITRNLVVDYLRKDHGTPCMPVPDCDGVLPEAIQREEFAETTARQDARLKALRVALDALPQQQRAIMLLRIEGNSLREISTLMAIPHGTVSVWNSRAIERLRGLIVPMIETQSL